MRDATLTTVTPAPVLRAARPLDIDAVSWERVQITIRARRGDRDLDDAGRFRLERLDGVHPVMPPTRVSIEGETLALRFNVMQGPDQDPLVPGRWTLTTAADQPGQPGQPGTPVRIGAIPTPEPTSDAAAFSLNRGIYRCVPSLDPTTRWLHLDVDLDETAAILPDRSGLAQWRALVVRTVRSLRSWLFRGVFALARLAARRNGRRILFTSDSRAELSGNLQLVHDRMIERGLDRDHEILTLFKPSIATSRSLADRLRLPWLLARADTIVIDDYQPIIYRVEFGPDVRIVQLWHASGPFKTVGYSRIGKVGGPGPWSRVHKNYTHAIVSAAANVPYYAEAFGIPEARVIPTGIPRMDRYFDPAQAAAGRLAAIEAFPQVVDRFTILFAPTFRGMGPRDAWYDPRWIDLPALHALATERDAVVILKMHPFVREPIDIPAPYRDRLIDGSGHPTDVNDLLFAVDLLITDYSSIVFEFSTLGRPMLFYAPDLDGYTAERDFYIPFAEFVPGRIVRTFDALLDAIRREDHEAEKVPAFAARHFAHLDASSTDRVIDQVLLAPR